MITIVVNGDELTVAENATMVELLKGLSIDPTKVAVEHNRSIVPRSSYKDVTICEGDVLEIVHFIGGG